jgi:prepilin-type N-terminal cleavage/methylation domain-containing protein
MSDRRARGDDGLTLVELIITILIVGVVMTAVAGALTVMLRTEGSSSGRLEESRGTQQLTTYFAQDVQSTPFSGDDTDPTATSFCTAGSAPAPNANVIRMYWTEAIPNGPAAQTYYASYRYEREGTDWVLARYGCTDSDFTPKRLVVARGLTVPAVGWTGTSTPPGIQLDSNSEAITLTITTKSNYRYTITGSRLAPPLAVAPCVATATANPPTVTLTGPAPATASPGVTVTANLTGSCPGQVELEVATGPSTVNLTMTDSPPTASLPNVQWTPGVKALKVKAGGVVVGGGTLSVVGCELTVTTNPSTVALIAGGLASSVVVTAEAANASRCQAPLTLTYLPTSAGTTASTTMVSAGVSTWTTTIAASTVFDAGPTLLNVRQSGMDGRQFSAVLTVGTPGAPCTMSSPAIAPQSIQLVGSGTMPSGASVHVVALNCGVPQVSYSWRNGSKTIPMIGGPGNTYAYNLPTNEVWDAGQASFFFVDSAGVPPPGGTAVATATLLPPPTCEFTNPAISPSSITLTATANMPPNVQLSVNATGACGTPRVQYTTRGPTVRTATMTSSGASFTYTLPTNETWDAVTSTFTFLPTSPATQPTAAVTAFVQPACQLSGPVTFSQQGVTTPIQLNGGSLNKDLAIDVPVNDISKCTGYGFEFLDPPRRNQSQGVQPTWVRNVGNTIEFAISGSQGNGVNSRQWSTGPKDWKFWAGDPNLVVTGTVNVS